MITQATCPSNRIKPNELVDVVVSTAALRALARCDLPSGSVAGFGEGALQCVDGQMAADSRPFDARTKVTSCSGRG